MATPIQRAALAGIAAMTLAALLAAPASSLSSQTASNLPVSTATGLTLGTLGGAAGNPAGIASAPGATVTAGLATVGEGAETVLAAGKCQPAVRLEVQWWRGTVTDQRDAQDAFVDERTAIRFVERQVPVHRLVTETVWTPPALFSGVASPITRTHAIEEGTRTATVPVAVQVPVAILVRWSEVYVEWQAVHETWHLTPAAGADHLASGTGTLEQACGPVLQHEPRAGKGWAYACVCLTRPENGWMSRLESVDAHLASAAEQAQLPRRDSSWLELRPFMLGPVQQAVEAYMASLRDGLVGVDGLMAPAPEAAETGDGGASAVTQAPTLRVPSDTALFGAVMAGVASLAAGIYGRVVMRRR